jgi:type IV pilus assembly protein PilA
VTGVGILGSGLITVTYSNVVPQINTQKLTLSPNIGGVVLAAGQTGNIDWACATLTHATATANGLAVIANGNLLARYTPTACK